MYNHLQRPQQEISGSRLFTVRILSKMIRVLGKIVYKLKNSEILKTKNEKFQELAPSTNRKNAIQNASILITTFEKRQFSAALPLVNSIRSNGIDLPIMVYINGNLDGGHDTKARSALLQELSKISAVDVICSNTMTGISRNWNLGIQLLASENILCLSDDIVISHGFKEDMEATFKLVSSEDFIVIGSFASFVISRKCIDNIGWFDERFMGFGEEDGDYIYRFLDYYKRYPRIYYSSGIDHLDMQTRGDEAAGVGKYSLFNLAFRTLKYIPDETGIQGSFNERHSQILKSFDFHPMESFRRLNSKLFYEDDFNSLITSIKI